MSLLPADYRAVYELCTGRTSLQIAIDMDIQHVGAMLRLYRLECAGYIKRNNDGGYEQAAPFDAGDVNRQISHGWTT